MKASAKVSIVIPSKLSMFKRCASDRENKFICAIESCLLQTFKDFEIIILADNCSITEKIYLEKYSEHPSIHCYQCSYHGDTWQRVSKLRNFGIESASGEIITYLDTDDVLGENHLKILIEEMKSFDWVYYDDYIVNKNLTGRLNRCELKFGKIGTCNVTHRKSIGVKWSDGTYKHDFKFVESLLQFPNYAKVRTPEYFICHQPGVFDV